MARLLGVHLVAGCCLPKEAVLILTTAAFGVAVSILIQPRPRSTLVDCHIGRGVSRGVGCEWVGRGVGIGVGRSE